MANSNNIRLHRLSDCTVFFDFDNTITRFDVLDIAGGYSRPRTDGFLKTALNMLDRGSFMLDKVPLRVIII